MSFRGKIFWVIFLTGVLPAIAILILSTVLLDSAINRIGATGLGKSLETASGLLDDTERTLGSLLNGCLTRIGPGSGQQEIKRWLESSDIDLYFSRKAGDPDRIYWKTGFADSAEFQERLPQSPGLTKIVAGNSLFISYCIGDSIELRGCAVLLPEDALSAGRSLAEASSAAASLGIYKEFTLELLAVAITIVILVAVVAGYFISAIISKRLVRPLARLTEGARIIGSGDLDHRVGLAGEDEFAGLGKSFDRMAGEIKENQQKILEVERLAAWREVARRIAHEIRNPLTPITVELYRLKQKISADAKADKAEIVELIDTIKRQIGVLQELASHFSAFAKEPELKQSLCSLRKIIDDSVALFSGSDSTKITVNYQEDLPDLNLDSNMMERLFNNLLKNSVEAPKVSEIGIDVKTSGDQIVILIKDNGPGFPEEKLNRIEQPYFTTKGSGTGLGLAISKKIAEEHGGRIRFYNENGAVVEIMLPI